MESNNWIATTDGPIDRVIGVYSGRKDNAPAEAQIGMVWHVDYIDDIIDGMYGTPSLQSSATSSLLGRARSYRAPSCAAPSRTCAWRHSNFQSSRSIKSASPQNSILSVLHTSGIRTFPACSSVTTVMLGLVLAARAIEVAPVVWTAFPRR
jgi:hypothetical protein